ncbi:hypothetical protein [Rhodococcus pyridinivorans]|uniref:hypothetical protein n=1 Tax=Rhodococcus pyridinivorans TaxID=103816 RepID=UPI0039B4D7A3
MADGTVISALHRRHRAVEFRTFLTTIDKSVPRDLDVHLVCDNYATHNTAEPAFDLIHPTRTGGSEVDVESGVSGEPGLDLGLLTDKLIRRGVHTSVQALENDITAWIETWNDNPRPFRWTKTADEILQSLADHLAKINPITATTNQ